MSDLVFKKDVRNMVMSWTYDLMEKEYLDAALQDVEKLSPAELDTDRIYAELSKVYNIKELPDEATSIIGDLMLSLDEPSVESNNGEWITDDLSGLMYCSRCGYGAPMETTGGGQYKSKFCPTCGVKMKDHY